MAIEFTGHFLPGVEEAGPTTIPETRKLPPTNGGTQGGASYWRTGTSSSEMSLMTLSEGGAGGPERPRRRPCASEMAACTRGSFSLRSKRSTPGSAGLRRPAVAAAPAGKRPMVRV